MKIICNRFDKMPACDGQITLAFAARCYASAAYAIMRCPSACLSVCVSVTFLHSVKTNKDIFNFFSPSGSHTILVFLYQTAWRYFDGTHPPNGTSNAGGVGRNRDSEPISGFTACCEPFQRHVQHTQLQRTVTSL